MAQSSGFGAWRAAEWMHEQDGRGVAWKGQALLGCSMMRCKQGLGCHCCCDTAVWCCVAEVAYDGHKPETQPGTPDSPPAAQLLKKDVNCGCLGIGASLLIGVS